MTGHDSDWPRPSLGHSTSNPIVASNPSTIRRAAVRLEYTCFAWIDGHGSERPIEGIARIVDISSRGVGLVLASPIGVGTRLVVELLILSQLRLRATGEVVHCRPTDSGLHHRVGVRFEGHAVLVD